MSGRDRVLLGAVLFGGMLFGCDKVYADPIVRSFSTPIVDAGLTTTRNPPVLCLNVPAENSHCYNAGTVCEYGKSPDPACNSLYVCESDPTYGKYWTEQTHGQCVAECPSSDAIVEGAACDLDDADGGDAGNGGDAAELQCTTSNGTCACTTGADGAHVHPRRWVCTKPAEDCPSKRPLLGQPCVGEHSCDYGSCDFKRGARMICVDQVWQIEARSCP